MTTESTAYWQIVLKCLTKLAHVKSDKARATVQRYRTLMFTTPVGLRRDMCYHVEPWQLAFQLAGLPDEELRSRKMKPAERKWYDKVVKDAVAEAAVIGTEDEVREFQMVS